MILNTVKTAQKKYSEWNIWEILQNVYKYIMLHFKRKIKYNTLKWQLMPQNIINDNIQNAQNPLVMQGWINVIEEKFIIDEYNLM